MINIDFSHLWHRSIHPNKNMILENINFCAHTTLSMILNVSKQFGASRKNPLVISVDSKPSWRHKYYETFSADIPGYEGLAYKGHRTKDPMFDWEGMDIIHKDILEALKLYSDFYVIDVKYAEADDVIAVLAQEVIDDPYYIVSSDKDFKQLQRHNVHIFDPIKGIFLPEIDVDHFKKIHFMVGDKSDNILAIKPKIAEKTAEKLYPELETLLATIPEMRTKYEFNKKLIDFDEIPCYIRDKIKKETEKQTHSFDAANLMKMFRKYELANLTERISEFKLYDKERTTPMISQIKQQKSTENYIDDCLDGFFVDE